MRDLYGERFEVAPYAVLFKPSHGLRILRNQDAGGFSPKAAYIFRKQLEEADAVVINRLDELPPEQVEELTDLLAEQFPGVPVLKVSALTGQGFDSFLALLDQQGAFGRKILSIDYDIYAEGEAELGWLNSSIHLSGPALIDIDPLLVEIVEQLQSRVASHGGEVAHLKVIGLTDGGFGVANLVSSLTGVELSLPSKVKAGEIDVIVNARIAMDPTLLEELVREVLTAAGQSRGLHCDFRQTQSLRPGRPTPTHRYAVPR
jgi:hypothetical protein